MRKLFVLLTMIGALLILGCQKQQDSAPIPTSQDGSGTSFNIAQEEQALKSVLQNDPQNLNTLIRLGNLYMDAKRYSEAVEYYNKALEIDPKDNNVRVDMGTCYRRAKQPDKAEKYYREALEIDPNHPMANLNLGVVLAFDFGRNNEAITYFENFLKIDPANPKAPQIRETIARLKQEAAKKGNGK